MNSSLRTRPGRASAFQTGGGELEGDVTDIEGEGGEGASAVMTSGAGRWPSLPDLNRVISFWRRSIVLRRRILMSPWDFLLQQRPGGNLVELATAVRDRLGGCHW
jgi:hypothetical protein